jgi:hypothetical protein
VIAREIDVTEVGAATAREHPDVASAGLELRSEHAPGLIAEIVHESCGCQNSVHGAGQTDLQGEPSLATNTLARRLRLCHRTDDAERLRD